MNKKRAAKKTRSMHGKTLSSKNKGLLHIPIDKTRTIFERIFVLRAPGRKTRRCIQFSSMGWVFGSPQHIISRISLSLVGVENPGKDRTQRELTQQIM